MTKALPVRRGRPKKSPGISPANSPPSTLETLPQSLNDDAGDDQVDSPETLFDAMADAQVRIQRYDDMSGRLELHGYLSITEATEGRVAELFGGGRYVAALVQPDHTGRKVIRRRREFKLPGAYKPPAVLPGIGQPTAAPVVTGTALVTADSGSPRVVSYNDALNQVLVSQVLETVKATREARPAWDMDKLILAISAAAELLGKIFRPDTGLREEIREIRSLVERQPVPVGPVTGATHDLMSAVKTVQALKDMINGNREDADTEKETTDPMVLLGVEALKVLQGAKTETRPVAQPQPQPQPSLPPDLPPWHRMLLKFGPQLVQSARRAIGPEFAAEVAVNYMPGDLEGLAQEFVQMDDAVSKLYQVLPDLQHHQKWTEKFFAAFKGLLLDEPEAGEPTDD